MRKRVYIAGPISKGCLLDNVNRATEAFVRLAKEGLAPFCPHWSVYSKPAITQPTPDGDYVLCRATKEGNSEMTHADWLGVDLPWVTCAHAVLRLSGESVGADKECEVALAAGIPVFDSVDQLLIHLRG